MVSPVPTEVVLARLMPDERRWVEELALGVRTMLGPRLADVRLFGSRARGERHDESDLDVLVLVVGLDSDTRWAIVDMAGAISTWLAPVVLDYDRYHEPASRATGFYKELRRESVRL